MTIHEKSSTRFNKNLSKVYEMLDKYSTEKEMEAINFFCHYADELSITENKLWV